MVRNPWLRRPRNQSISSEARLVTKPALFQHVERTRAEEWGLFVARAAAETLAYLKTCLPMFSEEGDVYVNVTWVSEEEFRNLKI